MHELPEQYPGEADLHKALDNLTFEPSDPEKEAELLAMLPQPGDLPADVDDMLTSTSFKLPVGMRRRLKQLAESRGLAMADLLRAWTEEKLAELEDEKLVLVRPSDIHLMVQTAIGKAARRAEAA